LERRHSWCISTEPGFARKAADIVGLYLNPPQNALIFAIDEKPAIQALGTGARLDPTAQWQGADGF